MQGGYSILQRIRSDNHEGKSSLNAPDMGVCWSPDGSDLNDFFSVWGSQGQKTKKTESKIKKKEKKKRKTNSTTQIREKEKWHSIN